MKKGIIKIDMDQCEIKYKGLAYTFRILRPWILKLNSEVTEDYELVSARHFNAKTGKIERKYAWDAIFHYLKEHETTWFEALLDGLKDDSL